MSCPGIFLANFFSKACFTLHSFFGSYWKLTTILGSLFRWKSFSGTPFFYWTLRISSYFTFKIKACICFFSLENILVVVTCCTFYKKKTVGGYGCETLTKCKTEPVAEWMKGCCMEKYHPLSLFANLSVKDCLWISLSSKLLLQIHKKAKSHYVSWKYRSSYL